MAVFQPPPTWADVIILDKKHPERSTFNPVWTKWFIDLVKLINAAGGGGGAINHNDLSGLQGGAANQYYHLSQTIYNAVNAISGVLTLLALTLSSGRLQEARGANVNSANNMSLGTDGNYFRIANATQINLLDSVSWQGGSVVTLFFISNPLVKHNQAASTTFKPIFLQGAVDFATAAKNCLTLRYDDADATWYEIARRT